MKIIMSNEHKKTAIHEAGHAVACYRLTPTRYVGMVTIIPNEEKSHAGAYWGEEFWPDNTAEEAQHEVMCLCAGYAACIAAGIDEVEARQGCDSDFETTEELIRNWKLAPLKDQLRQTVELMQQPENTQAVSRLEKELLEHELLLGEEIDVLIDVADGEVSELELVQYRNNAKVQVYREIRVIQLRGAA